MGRVATIARRTFLVGAVAVAGGVAFGYYKYRTPYENPLKAQAGEGEQVFTPYIKITRDGGITIITPRAEMGQGVTTTLAALVAEELDVDLAAIKTEHGPAGWAYYNEAIIADGGGISRFQDGVAAETSRAIQAVVAKFLGMQMTGGSTSIRDGFLKMREAGAAARHVMLAAAAMRWNVAVDTLKTEGGAVLNPATGDKLAYGELAEAAAGIELPDSPSLKPRGDWRLLGRPQARVDLHDKVTGAPVFGIDVELDGLVHATVRMAPGVGAKIEKFDADAAGKMPGVIDIVQIENGIGVIADNTWRAFKAADAVDVTWGPATIPATTDDIFAELRKALEGTEAEVLRNDGDVDKALGGGGKIVDATYEVPYLAHSCMEPMNATVRWKDGVLDVWTGTQAPTLVQDIGGREFDIAPDAVRVHTTSLGGGFGRRAEVDFVRQAMKLARHTGGRPVKLTWSREEDMQHDGYRPGAVARFRGLAGDGAITALDGRVATQSVSASFMSRNLGQSKPPGPDKAVIEGVFDQPYAIANYRAAGLTADLAIPVGFWRSVGHSHNGFFHETFIDELAHAAGKDPVQARLDLMKPWPTAVKVVEKVADMSGWGGTLPEGHGRGIAFVLSFGAWVAEVVEVSARGDGIRIEKVWCAADVGTALDPAIIEAQMRSGIIYGLSAAMAQEITYADGRVEQSNFHDFDALRINQAPAIDVATLENSPKLGGAGEPGTPPAAPALGNAIFAATGKRLRKLPFSKMVTFV